MNRTSIARRPDTATTMGAGGATAPVLLAAAVLFSTAGCITAPTIRTIESPTATSPRLNPFVYFEQGETLFLGVDGRAAQYADEDRSIVPLGLGLANLSRTGLEFTPESFVLETADGTRYPVISHEEFNRDYRKSRTDQRLADVFLEMLAQRFTQFQFRSWSIFPFKGQNVASSHRVELGRRQWLHTYLYFPMPESGIHGKQFTLLVRSRDVPETMIVRFALK